MNLQAQSFSRIDIPFIVDDSFIANPLTGGINAPQFSAVDLNGDGTQDLYLFDRHGEISLTFLWNSDLGRYEHAPAYAANFPKMEHWVLLRDFNQDGIQDIFTQATVNTISGARVFQGKMQNGRIAFDIVEFDHEFAPILSYTDGSNESAIINIGEAAYPNISDIDSDGDLDVMIPNFDGSHMYFFSNQTVEQNAAAEDFPFILADECWGDFFVNAMKKQVNLSSDTDACATAFQSDETDTRFLHNGNALLTIDMDNDGDKELIFGDILHDNLSYLVNGGTATNAWMISQDTLFPSSDVPAIIENYVTPFYLDVDGDNVKDLIAAPTALSGRLNTSWFYKNTQSNEMPVLELQQKNLFGSQMVDVGAHAHPVFVDYNMDGLLDLVVGNSALIDGNQNDEPSSALSLFRNIGTDMEPLFELVTRNWLGLKAFNETLAAFIPTFGDLDNDGDLDILIGNQAGTLLYAENTAGANNPMNFDNFQVEWQAIDVGSNSSPQLVDLNRDGTLDLVIGERTGNINYFPNEGTVENPIFHHDPDEQPNNFFLGEINPISMDFPVNQSNPIVLDFADGYHLFVGLFSGNIRHYSNIDDNLDMPFDLLNDSFGDLDVGVHVRPAIADLNNDGILEMIVGNARGGLSAFQTNLDINGMVSTHQLEATEVATFYPNPTNDLVHIEWATPLTKNANYTVFNALGHQVQSGTFAAQNQKPSLNLSTLSTGIYFCKIRIDGQLVVRTIVKN